MAERSTVDRLEILAAARTCATLTQKAFQLSKDLGQRYFQTKDAQTRTALVQRIVDESAPNAAAFSVAMGTELEALFGVDAGARFRQIPRLGSAGKAAAEIIIATYRQASGGVALTDDHMVIIARWVARIVAGAGDALGQLEELVPMIEAAGEQRDA